MKKFFIILLVLIIVGAAAYFIYPKFSDNGQYKSTRNGNNNAGEDDRKSYSSSQFGISFEYPSSWVLSEAEPGLIIIKPMANITDELAPISIDVRGVEPYEDALREIRINAVGKAETELTFGKYKAVAVSGKLSPDIGENAGVPFTFTMINHAGQLYSIDYIEFGSESAGARDVYLGIVGSFKFADSQ